ncbi:uncharacterized protein LOC135683188 [Rhopilema esculentum]|uniref:uncharacterized protein LOC135683188 n=1 Tax=Rhopilema esculentum TaxID=499914 RepID=UPI0031DF8FF2
MSTQEDEVERRAEAGRIENGNMERLKRTRGGNRAVITRFEREATLIIRDHGDALTTEILAKLDSILSVLQQKRRLLCNLNDEILAKCHIDEIEKEIEESAEIDVKIEEIISRIGACKRGTVVGALHGLAEPTGVSTPTPAIRNELTTDATPFAPANGQLNRSGSSSRSENIGVKLPKINLPNFSGDVTKYQAFWQSFQCAVHENEQISAVHKMNYLMRSLEGTAFKALEGLAITEENYEHAINILQTRFGNPQQIISAHMQALLNLQSCPKETVSQIRAIYDNINVHVRGLETLGISSERYGSLLVPVIMSRMPAEITLQVARKTSEQIWRIDEILDIIRKEIEAREISRKLDTKTTRKSERTSLTEYRGTTRAFAVIKDGKRERKLQCYFCQGEHYAEKCKVVTSIEERKSKLIEGNRCFNCLRIGHRAKTCRSPPKCFHCKSKHNSALHEDLVMEEKRGVPALQTTVNSASDERKNVLLQTAQTYGFGADRSEKQLVNILFDSGSQRSYISEETVKKLGLKVEKTETVYLNIFGSNKYEKKSCDRVTVNLEVGDEILTLTVLSSPHLCLPLSTPIDVSCYPHLQGLQLADSYATCEKRIELVIGVDYYYRIVQGEVRKGGNGLVAISSKLGWLLCGPVVCNEGDKSSLNNVMNLIVDVLPSRDEITDDSREIVESLTKFWKHESAGLYETENPEDKKTDDGGVDINFKDGRYTIDGGKSTYWGCWKLTGQETVVRPTLT